MTPQPAVPFTSADLARLRARHRADQQAARRDREHARRGKLSAPVVAQLLLVVFLVAGCYAAAAAVGLVAAVPGSAVAGG